MAKSIMLVSLAAAVLAVPTLASAGDYDYRGYNTDYKCQQRTNNQQTTGGIIGALAGAAIGSNVAGRGVRTEGAVLGAVVGAVAGSAIGKKNSACDDQYEYERNRRGNQNYGYNNGYNQYGSYDRDRHERHHDRNDNYYDNSSYNSYGNRYPTHQASYSFPTTYGRDNCGWGSATYQLPNGQWSRERVYMCRSYNGQWVVSNR